jgi:hypothetical protein
VARRCVLHVPPQPSSLQVTLFPFPFYPFPIYFPSPVQKRF